MESSMVTTLFGCGKYTATEAMERGRERESVSQKSPKRVAKVSKIVQKRVDWQKIKRDILDLHTI
jgi:hypothetical protein